MLQLELGQLLVMLADVRSHSCMVGMGWLVWIPCCRREYSTRPVRLKVLNSKSPLGRQGRSSLLQPYTHSLQLLAAQ